MAGVKRNINEMYNNHNGSNNNNCISNNKNNCNLNGLNGNGINNNSCMNDLNNDNSHSMSNTNEAKKTRLDNNQTKQEPSRVVHLRNIPNQLTENEIIYLGLSFGNITNVLFLRSKNQAFLEFENLSDAPLMISHFNNSPATFSGKKIFVQYSNHQELNTDPSNSNNQHAKTALAEACALHYASKNGGKNTVLRATILNMMYPVTLDVLQQIFSKFGHVLKIITFTKNDKFQVLIQMKDSSSAQNAKMSLNNQNIYNGCCTLQIDFSKLTTLEVRFNNDKSKDYTNLLLPSGQDGQSNQSNNNMSSQNSDHNLNNHGNNMGGQMGMQYQQSLIGNPPNLFAAVQAAANGQLPFSNVHQQHNNNMNNQYGNHNNNQYNQNNNQMNMLNSQNQHGNNNNNGNSGVNSPVLLVSNLNEDFCSTEALFTLFGVYGDVLRVKILFNKKDSALINFSNVQQASTALQNLDRCKLWQKQIRVFPSKHLTVQMPKDGQPDSGLTKDFSNSPLHRFKKPGSKNFNNIFPPSQTLHLSNIPANVQEQELRDLFGTYGTVRGFKFFQKDRKMALIQMDTVEEAITALIATHNYQLAENMHLRCTFSKATI